MLQKNLTSQDKFTAVLKHYGLFQDLNTYKIVCPFHGDKNPSMQINQSNNFFYCYGCGASGGYIDLVKRIENLNSIEAYKKVFEICNEENVVHIQNYSQEYVEKKNSDSIKTAKDFYFNLPETNWYKSNEEYFQIKRYMLKRGFKSGILNEYEAKATYNSNYPIVFPIYDNGIFRGYVMRTDNPEVEDRRKYMYNRGFRRSNTLAGQYRDSTVVIVEGFLDKLAGNQLGFKNIVAILGWKISSYQFEKLKRKNVKCIICALDNDESGNKGYKYLKRICKSSKIVLKRIRFKKGIKDFGDLLNNKIESKNVISQLKMFHAT